MAKLTPYCPSGTVSFCKTFGPASWSSVSGFLETEEALEDYAKFCSSLMDTYTSLTMSISSDNEVLMGWHCRDELKRLESYNIAANVRSSSLMKHNTDVHQLMMGSNVQGFTALTDEVGGNVQEYSYHLKRLHNLHRFFAYRKSLAKRDFIKWDSDFDEVFQRLKSEQQWTHLSDEFLRLALEEHFSLLRKLNDNLGMSGLVSVSNMPEGDELLEAINNQYSQEVSDLFKDFKERSMKGFFSKHMEVKLLQRKLFNQAELSRTAIIPKDCHFTSPKLSPLINTALVHRNRALEKIQELKGRWGRGFGALRSRLLPAGVLFISIPVAYIGGKGMQKG